MITRPPALLFGVPIADLTMDETLDLIDRFVAHARAAGTTHQIATVNVDFLVNAIEDPEVKSILVRSDLCLADGNPVVWGSRMLGMPVAERVAGADLLPRLAEHSARTGLRVHVFGSAPHVAERARTLLADRWPGNRVTIDPGPIIADPTVVDDEVLDGIADLDPDVLCVALGNPKQEHFIAAHRNRLRTPVMIGIGGSVDMLVGERRRAPLLVQRLGFEWVFRAAQEPRRLGARYARDARVFGPRFAAELRANRRRRSTTALHLDVDADRVAAVFGPASGGAAWADAAAALADGGRTLTISADGSDPSDAAIAALAGLVRVARWHDATIRWTDLGGSALPSSLADRLGAAAIDPWLVAAPTR